MEPVTTQWRRHCLQDWAAEGPSSDARSRPPRGRARCCWCAASFIRHVARCADRLGAGPENKAAISSSAREPSVALGPFDPASRPAAEPGRPAVRQGLWRHLRRLGDRAGHRGARARRLRPRWPPRSAAASRPHRRLDPLGCRRARPRRAALKAAPDRRRPVVAISGSRDRPGCGGVHQVAGALDRRRGRGHRRALRHPPGTIPSPRSPCSSTAAARRSAPRSAMTSTCAISRGVRRAAARQGQGQQRLLRAGALRPPVRRRLHDRRRALGGDHAAGREARTTMCSRAPPTWPRSAAIRSSSSARRSASTSIPTASSCSSAPCSRRSRTAINPAGASRTRSAIGVAIASPKLGRLANRVGHLARCAAWTDRHRQRSMANLAGGPAFHERMTHDYMASSDHARRLSRVLLASGCVVTGGASGIGAALVEAFAAQGSPRSRFSTSTRRCGRRTGRADRGTPRFIAL